MIVGYLNQSAVRTRERDCPSLPKNRGLAATYLSIRDCSRFGFRDKVIMEGGAAPE